MATLFSSDEDRRCDHPPPGRFGRRQTEDLGVATNASCWRRPLVSRCGGVSTPKREVSGAKMRRRRSPSFMLSGNDPLDFLFARPPTSTLLVPAPWRHAP